MIFRLEEGGHSYWGRQWLWCWGHSLCCSGLGFILKSIFTAPTLFSMIIYKQQCCLKIYYSPSHFLPWPEKWMNNEKIHTSPQNLWLWSPFNLTVYSWRHFTPGASCIPVALVPLSYLSRSQRLCCHGNSQAHPGQSQDNSTGRTLPPSSEIGLLGSDHLLPPSVVLRGWRWQLHSRADDR